MLTLPAPPAPYAARRGRRAPRVQGAPTTQLIREPSLIVGQDTNHVYGTIADGGQAETVSNIRPTLKPATRPMGMIPGVPANYTGAELSIINANGWDPNDPNTQTTLNYLNSAAGSTTRTALQPVTQQQAAARAAATVVQPQAASSMPAGGQATATGNVQPKTLNSPAPAGVPNYGAAGTNIFNANAAVNTATQGVIDAAKPVQQAQQGVITATENANTKATRASTSQQAALDAAQAYNNLQQTNNATRAATEAGVQAAEGNVQDQAAVARAQTIRDSLNASLSRVGITPSQEVINTPGQVLPPGVVSKLETQADIRKRGQTAQDASLGFVEKGSSLNAASASNVASSDSEQAHLADIQRASASTLLQSAQAGQQVAQTALDQARLNLTVASTAPAPGLVLDSTTGNFVTPQVKAVIDNGLGVGIDPATGQKVTQDQLQRDGLGNILSPTDHNWYSSDGKNVLLNGVWTDRMNPRNQYIAQPDGTMAWTDTQTGNKLVAGVWWTPDGYYQSGAEWINPVTGDRRPVGGNFAGQTFQNASGGLAQQDYSSQGLTKMPDGSWGRPDLGASLRADGSLYNPVTGMSYVPVHPGDYSLTTPYASTGGLNNQNTNANNIATGANLGIKDQLAMKLYGKKFNQLVAGGPEWNEVYTQAFAQGIDPATEQPIQ